MNKSRDICIIISFFNGIGPVIFQKLLEKFGSGDRIYDATDKELLPVLGKVLTQKFVSFRKRFDLNNIKKYCQENEIFIITLLEKEYPQILKEIIDPPICLFVKGDFQNYSFNNQLHVAIVGTRKPTSYGQFVTKKITKDIVLSGVSVVSGMALGIDALSHWVSLDNNGLTIAVLGCGVDVIYPKENALLYREIIKKGGLIISEFPPGTISHRGHFVARNRIISGLSNGVFIVEGLNHSGSLITARYALNQGKEVFAPPCPIDSDYSFAPNMLLKEGAKLVTEGADILQEFGIKEASAKKSVSLSINQQKIFDELKKEPQSVDDLSIKLKIPIQTLLGELTIFEIQNIVFKNSAGKYEVL